MTNTNEVTIEQSESQPRSGLRLEVMWWVSVLIWVGILIGAAALNFLPRIAGVDILSWGFLIAAVFTFLSSIYRIATPGQSNPTIWAWIWGGIFLLLGLSGANGWNISWPLVLVLMGGATLGNVLWRRRNR